MQQQLFTLVVHYLLILLLLLVTTTTTTSATMASSTKLNFVELKPKPDPTHGVPCTRSSHGLSMICGGKKLVLYGGEHVARTPIEDHEALWVADCIDNDDWQWKCVTTPTTTKTTPPSRVAHAQAAVGDTVYIFGGRAGITMQEQAMNDLWKFEGDEWTEVTTTGDAPPSKRSFHKMVANHGNLFVFGGCGEEGRLNDLYKLDLTTLTWHSLGKSSLLRGRGGANLISLPSEKEDKVAIVGGFAGEETNDGHVYEGSAWHDVGMDVSGMRPRSVCVSGCIGTVIVIFGGEVDPSERGHEGAGGFENDVVVLDAATGKYLETMRTSLQPETRGWADGAVSGKSLYVFGGLSGDDATPKRLNDLWRLDVEEE